MPISVCSRKAGGIDPDAVPINPTQPQDAVAVIQRKGLDGYVGNAPFTEMGIYGGWRGGRESFRQ